MAECTSCSNGALMRVLLPLTIEILGLKDGASVVVERVIGLCILMKRSELVSICFPLSMRKLLPRVIASSTTVTS